MDDKTDSEFLSNGPTRRQAIFGIAVAFGLSLAATEAGAQGNQELSHTAESIHQEVVLKANRKRVYQALLDSKQFEQIVKLSDAMKTVIPPGAPPTKINPEVGGAFKTFGGLIEGRQIELVPDSRIVQAWRPAYWEAGVYSLVKFEFSDSGAGTKIVLDHRGFPDGDGKTLLEGWSKNYWQPMAKFLV